MRGEKKRGRLLANQERMFLLVILTRSWVKLFQSKAARKSCKREGKHSAHKTWKHSEHSQVVVKACGYFITWLSTDFLFSSEHLQITDWSELPWWIQIKHMSWWCICLGPFTVYMLHISYKFPVWLKFCVSSLCEFFFSILHKVYHVIFPLWSILVNEQHQIWRHRSSYFSRSKFNLSERETAE